MNTKDNEEYSIAKHAQESVCTQLEYSFLPSYIFSQVLLCHTSGLRTGNIKMQNPNSALTSKEKTVMTEPELIVAFVSDVVRP
jgi:hypothetical protein